jgi:DNA-binding NtrC family response regulator
MLRRQGFTVLEAVNGVEALEIAEQHPGPIHLLLTDWRMPRLDGAGLIRGLSNGHPEMAILVMSGNMDVETPYKGPFLSKPFKVPDLVQAVNAALESRFQHLTIT